MSNTEACPGIGAFARDLAGNPGGSCPVCGKFVRLTKSGCIRYHKSVAPAKQSELEQIRQELSEARDEFARAKRRVFDLRKREEALVPSPRLHDTEGKRYVKRSGKQSIVYVVDKIKRDTSYQPTYNFDVVTVRLLREDGKGARWVQDSEFKYDYVELID